MPQSVQDAIRPPATNMSQILFFLFFFGKVSFLECNAHFIFTNPIGFWLFIKFTKCYFPCAISVSFHKIQSSSSTSRSPLASADGVIAIIQEHRRRKVHQGCGNVIFLLETLFPRKSCRSQIEKKNIPFFRNLCNGLYFHSHL